MEMRWNKDGDKTEMRRRRDTDATHTHKGFVNLFYDFWIQKSHHFYGFWIQNFFCPSLQFLYPETAVFLLFLDPKTAEIRYFQVPEIMKIDTKKNLDPKNIEMV